MGWRIGWAWPCARLSLRRFFGPYGGGAGLVASFSRVRFPARARCATAIVARDSWEVCKVAHTDKTAPWRVKAMRIRRCAEGVAIDKDFVRWNGGARRLVGKRVRSVTRAALRGMRGDVGAWDAYTDARLSDYRRDWDFYADF